MEELNRRSGAETVYLMVRVRVQSSFEHISDIQYELENKTSLAIADTENIRVIESEILLTRVRKPQ